MSIVDEDRIHEVNKEFRGMDKATDVLSFPLNDYNKAADFDDFDENAASFNFDTGELMLGDIIISAAHVIKQADEYGHTRKRDEKLMFSKQDAILALGGYKR